MLIGDFLVESAQKHSGRVAVITENRRFDYAEMFDFASRLASAEVAAGLRRGDRVVIYTDNSAGYVAAYFGTLLAGGVVVGQSAANKERHIRNIVNHCEAAGVITAGRNLAVIEALAKQCPSLKFVFYDGAADGAHLPGLVYRELPEIIRSEPPLAVFPAAGAGDLAQIIYTSGTTGNPKGVMLSHGNLRANTLSIIEYLRLTPEDRVMVVLPFFYSYGNSLLLTHVACGGSLVIDNRFAYPQKIVERLAAEEVTGFAGVPSTFAILLDKTELASTRLPSLRYVTQAGGAMSPALTKRLHAALPGAEIFVMYGQTEASARLSYLEPHLLFEKLGTIGKAIPGVTLAVKNEQGETVGPNEIGEIVARGENIMMGYWRNEAETTRVLKADGLHTGDLATVDPDGFISIVARASDMIKSGAHRISPKEIEEIIMEDDRVHEVAVIGEADPLLGETPVALVVPKPGARIAAQEVARLCGKHLPLYKIPKKIEFRGALPKTTSGKVQKHLLRKEFERADK